MRAIAAWLRRCPTLRVEKVKVGIEHGLVKVVLVILFVFVVVILFRLVRSSIGKGVCMHVAEADGAACDGAEGNVGQGSADIVVELAEPRRDGRRRHDVRVLPCAMSVGLASAHHVANAAALHVGLIRRVIKVSDAKLDGPLCGCLWRHTDTTTADEGGLRIVHGHLNPGDTIARK